MPVHKMTPQETKDWLGAGLVMPAPVPPQPPQQETNVDQVAHDQRMAQHTPAQRAAMVRGLGALARSKLGPDADPAEEVQP